MIILQKNFRVVHESQFNSFFQKLDIRCQKQIKNYFLQLLRKFNEN